MTMEQLIRCFIACDLPSLLVDELVRLQKMIREKNLFVGRWVGKEQLHLTLKFLGEISEKNLTEAKKRLAKIHFAPFTVSLGEIGLFSPSSTRILWIQLLGAEEIQASIDNTLHGLFPSEHRFMGHITLARIKEVKNLVAFREYLSGIEIKRSFLIDRFYLKQSQLSSRGSHYTNLEEYHLNSS